jgi:hypothetical protein
MPPILGHSDDPDVPGVTAENPDGYALVADSTQSFGIVSRSHGAGIGVYGESAGFNGVRGISYAPGQENAAVFARNENHDVGAANAPLGGPGVYAVSDGQGVFAFSHKSHGLWAISETQNPAPGHGAGVLAESHGYSGVRGVTYAPGQAGVAGFGASPNSIGVYGQGPRAGRFEGDVEITGDIRLLNADCAEDFDIAHPEHVDPGTVMVLANEGALRASHRAYDRRVAGVVSGAGDYQPALVLDRQPSGANRQPIALMGKVFCKVDAQYGPVEIGDLLTTSPTPGHAMKAGDPLQAFGAVIGKALRPLEDGQGLIPVLVALQ